MQKIILYEETFHILYALKLLASLELFVFSVWWTIESTLKIQKGIQKTWHPLKNVDLELNLFSAFFWSSYIFYGKLLNFTEKQNCRLKYCATVTKGWNYKFRGCPLNPSYRSPSLFLGLLSSACMFLVNHYCNISC